MSFSIVHGSSRMQLILTASSHGGLEKNKFKLEKTSNLCITQCKHTNSEWRKVEAYKWTIRLTFAETRGFKYLSDSNKKANCKKNNNLRINYKEKGSFGNRCRPLQSSCTVRLRQRRAALKMEARHGCQSPLWKTTTSTPPAQTAPPARKNSPKPHKNHRFPLKHRSHNQND